MMNTPDLAVRADQGLSLVERIAPVDLERITTVHLDVLYSFALSVL
jgi:hypothetical protein